MKKNLVCLFVLVILWPVVFTGSKSQNSVQDASEIKHNIYSSAYFDLAPIEDLFKQLSPTPSLGEYSLEILPIADAPVVLYNMVEMDLRTSIKVINPYDFNEIDLRVAFHAPSGKVSVVGAFWYQDFVPGKRQPAGRPGWKVRFTPDEAGEWRAAAFATAQGMHSAPVSFTVRPSNQPGFIRTNPKNPRYLAYDNGDFFFPIGVNMAWYDDYRNPIHQYDTWLEAFTANGGNTIRVWMADWSFGIEWKDTGLGNYDKRQYQAWLLDRLFQLADEHGVKVILVLINHGAFSLEANSEWKDNPYNAELGGPLTNPEQFVTDPVARAFFRQKLKYIIDRWGYSPDLLAWEWFNEVNLTPISDGSLIPWLLEMTAFLQERDVNRHLTTSSFAIRAQSIIWLLPGLDIVQTHEYSSQINEVEHDLGDRAVQEFQALAVGAPRKPILMGEFGYSAKNYGDDIELTGIHLHNGLWATTFSGYAGSGMYWWWDIYIAAHDLWQHFKGLADFVYGEDLTQYRPFSPVQISRLENGSDQAVGLGLKGTKTMIWLRSSGYTTQASVAARAGNQDSAGYEPPLVEGLYLTLNDMAEGKYLVNWYDPQGAKWLEQTTAVTEHGELVIPIPAFREDLAAKIERTP